MEPDMTYHDLVDYPDELVFTVDTDNQMLEFGRSFYWSNQVIII